jgi:Uma2 family endonuclease
MATALLKRPATGDDRISFCASWELYETLAQAIGDQHVRLAFDGERIEMVSPGMDHESDITLIYRIVAALADGLGMLCYSMRSGRWRRPEAQRGLEADESFYFSGAKIAIARRRPKDEQEYPVPDLAVEIDISPSKIDRPAIYAALRVAEVWRYDGGQSLRIDRLGPDGTFAEAAESGWLGITPAEVVALLEMDFRDHNDFARKVTAWAVESLRPRRASWFVP